MKLQVNKTGELERLASGLSTLSLAGAVAGLSALTSDPLFWQQEIRMLLEQEGRVSDLSIVRSFGTPGHSALLQFYVWPAGCGTAIHDHSSWGVLTCVVGSLWEERYERLDNGAQPDRAHLRKLWERPWGCLDGVSTFLPYEAGIHRITNRGDGVALSLHVYGPRQGTFDGRDYDPATDSVCARFEVE
jgi:hypothetical protein